MVGAIVVALDVGPHLGTRELPPRNLGTDAINLFVAGKVALSPLSSRKLPQLHAALRTGFGQKPVS